MFIYLKKKSKYLICIEVGNIISIDTNVKITS